jgi:hypothetical protein
MPVRTEFHFIRAVQMIHVRSSDALGFHEQQHDSTDERERSDGGRDKMVVGGLNVHPEELDGFSRSRETDARINEDNAAEGDQKDSNDGFCIHIESMINFPG